MKALLIDDERLARSELRRLLAAFPDVTIDQVKGGTIPGQFIPAVEKGVRQVLETGVIAGYRFRKRP